MRVIIKYVSMPTVIKTQISKLLHTTPFCNNIDQVAPKIVENDKSLGASKHMPEGEEPQFLLIITLFRNCKFQY